MSDDRLARSKRRATVQLVAARLDDALFEPGTWFAIDASNRRVPGVTPGTRVAGLGLVGRGAVAAIVGRLRPGVLVVDIDLDARGHWVIEQLTAWCREHGVWHVARESGGGDGRWHLFAVPGDWGEPFAAEVERLRTDLHVARTLVDVRTTVRPLTAPHRTGVDTSPLLGSNPHTLIAGLERALSPTAKLTQTRVRPSVPVPLLPRPRAKRSLPVEWERYLITGLRPQIGGSDHSRSTYEAICTGMLLRAGYSADEAWQRILTAHPQAMDKARTRKLRWIKVWNRAIQDDKAQPAPRTSDPAVLAAIADVQNRLWSLMPGERGRVSVLRVGLALLDRMQRTGQLRVPCAERDLILDTGIRDRKTIRAALRTLASGGVGILHTDTVTPTRDHSYEFEILPYAGKVRKIPPPSIHNPPPPAWHHLPPTASLLWHALARHSSASSPLELLVATGSLAPGVQPNAHQIRATLRVLTSLGRMGLVSCDERGLWSISGGGVGAEVDQMRCEARAAYNAAQTAVAIERADYRRRKLSQWGQQRAEAIERDHDRHRRWWDGLSPDERARRRHDAVEAFERIPCSNQAQLKHQWALRRVNLGMNEAQRHRDWLTGLPAGEYERRQRHYTARHTARTRSEQYQAVRMWETHRKRFGIPRGNEHVPQAMLLAA